jgi:[acyl-carrier-protein] S-malonyltransferase
MTGVNDLRDEMLAQLTSSVHWVKSMEWMEAQGVTLFLELGAKDVLTGLNKRIVKSASTRPVGTVEQIEKYISGDAA